MMHDPIKRLKLLAIFLGALVSSGMFLMAKGWSLHLGWGAVVAFGCHHIPSRYGTLPNLCLFAGLMGIMLLGIFSDEFMEASMLRQSMIFAWLIAYPAALVAIHRNLRKLPRLPGKPWPPAPVFPELEGKRD